MKSFVKKISRRSIVPLGTLQKISLKFVSSIDIGSRLEKLGGFVAHSLPGASDEELSRGLASSCEERLSIEIYQRQSQTDR